MLKDKLNEILDQTPIVEQQDNGSWSYSVLGFYGDHYETEVDAYALALECIIEEAKKTLNPKL